MRSVAVGLVLVGMAGLAVAQNIDPNTAPWEYEGKRGSLEWNRLDPAYRACAAGHEQSPIDIHGAKLNKGLQPLEFHSISGPITLENNGHTVVAHVDKGSFMIAGGVRYELLSFDFHHPSETPVKGKLTDMDVQLVYQSAGNKVAIVEVRLLEDFTTDPNPVLAALWPHLPKKTGQTEKVAEFVNPSGLLPPDKGYWTYMGSLAKPPCSEGVRWFVMEQEVTLSRPQLLAFAALFKINTRPVQDTHGRHIEANE